MRRFGPKPKPSPPASTTDMTLTIDPESTHEAMPVARLIRVMRYEHAELGGGPVIDLGGIPLPPARRPRVR